MAAAPTPAQIFERAVAEGERRLAATPLELVATGFNAGFTIVFGVAALGIVHGLTVTRFGVGAATLTGSAAFGIGLVFLVVSRAELFTENFFDPVATALRSRRASSAVRLARLWTFVLVLNFVGATLLVALISVDGVLPPSAERSLNEIAREIMAKPADAALVNALVGGAVVTLLSFLLAAVDSTASRIAVAFLVGFFLAVGPFAHVTVTAAHLTFAAFNGGGANAADVVTDTAIAVAGNLVGGLLFVTMTHIAQARTERR